MKIIIPMAGMGKRMRPHTLTVPKPLVPIVGKPIVNRLVEDIAKVCGEQITEVAFIIGDFGKEVEARLIKIAESIGAKGSIYYQREALGTAHAIQCAKDSLSGKVVVAFADTLFKADFKLDTSKEGIIWVQKVEDPRPFGVVQLNDKNEITNFVEKPETFVSDLAIIGIYYFSDGERLKKEIQFVIDNEIKDKGEYQLTSALENMRQAGVKFFPGRVTDWLDCGNKDSTVDTNARYLEYVKDQPLIAKSAVLENCTIIPPVYVGEKAHIKNSVVGPHVSIGDNTRVENSVITRTIVQTEAHILNARVHNSMVGNHAHVHGSEIDLSVGDYNVIKL
ncbi:MAG: rfbA [Cytophagaceae bacterium]|jgi:glucose-1-phosphate thymidylyltransferase|nr:rfbA [Cytophagaceae bacterium]